VAAFFEVSTTPFQPTATNFSPPNATPINVNFNPSRNTILSTAPDRDIGDTFGGSALEPVYNI